MVFEEWVTPFSNGDISLVRITWGGSDWSIAYPNGDSYQLKSIDSNNNLLTIELFHRESESIYQIISPLVSAFKVLDEGALLELWMEKTIESNCFKVTRNEQQGSCWGMNDSSTTSHVIATDNECIEVLFDSPPQVNKLQKILPLKQGE